MADYTRKYPTRINWLDYPPDVSTPINASNLNKMDYALYAHDGDIENLYDTIETLNESIATLNSEISALTARVEALEAIINAQ